LASGPTSTAIYLDSETRIQVLETMAQLARADKEQCGAFVRDERVLVIWSDNLENILPIYHDFEDKLIKCVWKHVSGSTHRIRTCQPFPFASSSHARFRFRNPICS
jgi:hypothetical protein